MHQEMHYPGRVVGTDLANPDFAALARAYGGHGETVERTEQFADCLRPRPSIGQTGADRNPHRFRSHHAGPQPERAAAAGGRREKKLTADLVLMQTICS